MIDYRLLLIKYMNHVGEHEGIDFLNQRYYHPDGYFTFEEWTEMQELKEIILE